MSTLMIEIDPQAAHRLDVLSREAGLTPAELVRAVLNAYLEDREDLADSQAVLERIARQEEGTLTLDELERRLGLEG